MGLAGISDALETEEYRYHGLHDGDQPDRRCCTSTILFLGNDDLCTHALHKNKYNFVLYAAVMASFIGTTCWNEGTFRAGGVQAGYFGNLFPIFSGALAIIILGEELRWYHVVGAVSVLIGIWLATFGQVRIATKGD